MKEKAFLLTYFFKIPFRIPLQSTERNLEHPIKIDKVSVQSHIDYVSELGAIVSKDSAEDEKIATIWISNEFEKTLPNTTIFQHKDNKARLNAFLNSEIGGLFNKKSFFSIDPYYINVKPIKKIENTKNPEFNILKIENTINNPEKISFKENLDIQGKTGDDGNEHFKTLKFTDKKLNGKNDVLIDKTDFKEDDIEIQEKTTFNNDQININTYIKHNKNENSKVNTNQKSFKDDGDLSENMGDLYFKVSTLNYLLLKYILRPNTSSKIIVNYTELGKPPFLITLFLHLPIILTSIIIIVMILSFDTGITKDIISEEISKLPVQKYTSSLAFTECSICLENYQIGEDVRILNCKHCFHRNCIDSWLKNMLKCPICRDSVTKLANSPSYELYQTLNYFP